MPDQNLSFEHRINQIYDRNASKLADLDQLAHNAGEQVSPNFESIRRSSRKVLEQVEFLREREARRKENPSGLVFLS